MTSRFNSGDVVVYVKQKWSSRPGPRARNVHPSQGGEQYAYLVDKFWVVVEVRDDGMILLRTRRGKEHLLHENDPHLRRPSLWEKLTQRGKFPILEAVAKADE